MNRSEGLPPKKSCFKNTDPSSEGSSSCSPNQEPLSPLGKEVPEEPKTVSFNNMTRVVLLPEMDIDVDSLFYNEKEIEEFRYDAWLEERGLTNKGVVTKAFKFVLRVI